MKIIALSDTHSQPLPKVLLDDLKTADLIVHAGDFSDRDVYERLKMIGEVRAVYGNVDGTDLRDILPKQAVFVCQGVKIGLAHGEGSPVGLVGRLQEVFKGQGVGVVIFGHSHMPCHDMVDGVLFFNPGSPTDMIRAPYRSYGVLEVSEGKVKAKIIKIKG